jgi:hypothetical protein
MYKRIEPPDETATLWNGEKFKPVATLASESGGRCQISIDDHCYVLRLLQQDGSYMMTAHIFEEAHEALRTLPKLESNSTTKAKVS